MKEILIIFQRDFREIRQSNAFRIICGLSLLLLLGISLGASIALNRQSWLGEPAARPFLIMITGIIAYFVPLFIMMAFIWAFASLPVTREKANGNIECLIATPISPRTLWLGKSLAIFLPGFLISCIVTCIIILIINLSTLMPATGVFILPLPGLLTGFFINPLLLFGTLSLTILLSLISNPDVAVAPSFLVGFGLMIGMMLGLALGVISFNSWIFLGGYLGGTFALWMVVLHFSRYLVTERIVLSSKGD